ncbi:hypothetical protein D3C78_1175440 [compost metagenome]
MTNKRESSPLRIARTAWRWAVTCRVRALPRGNCCLSCNELGRRRVSASLAGLKVDSGSAETDEFIFKASWAGGGFVPARSALLGCSTIGRIGCVCVLATCG